MNRPAMIRPESLYDDATLVGLLGISCVSLSQARRTGELRHRRIGQQTVYLGAWVLAWITGERAEGQAGAA